MIIEYRMEINSISSSIQSGADGPIDDKMVHPNPGSSGNLSKAKLWNQLLKTLIDVEIQR